MPKKQPTTRPATTYQPATYEPVTTGQHKAPLYDAAARLLKEALWRWLTRFTPQRPPICLYASRRSGSTLLMEMIGANPGVMFSDQPFCAYTASPANLNRLPLFPYGQITHPDLAEAGILKTYIDDLFAGRIRANAPWKLTHPTFHARNNRLCLKITDGKGLVDWIDQHYDVRTVVLTRHPIAQALSVTNVGWLTTGKGLLRSPGYIAQWLTSAQEAFCWDIYQSGSEFEQRILDWALENLPLVSLLPQRPQWLYVSYEHLVGDTEEVVVELARRLALENPTAMLRLARRPSRSTRRESTRERQELIRRHDASRLVASWQDKTSASECARCDTILARLGIRLYDSTQAHPHSDAWEGAIGRARVGARSPATAPAGKRPPAEHGQHAPPADEQMPPMS